MAPPNKISPEINRYYDEKAGLCLAPEQFASFNADVPTPKKNSDEFIRVSPAQLNVLASAGSHVVPASTLRRHSSLKWNPILLPLSAAGCSFESGAIGSGNPIAGIRPVGEETPLNMDPIVGKIRQVVLAISPESRGVTAWSVSDFDDAEAHGVFALPSEGDALQEARRIAEAVGNIPRDTSAAVLSNGESVVVFSQIQGDDAPSSLMVQRLDVGGDPSGDLIEILPETIRAGFPQGQVIAGDEGFIVVFRDGEGKLMMAAYDLGGQELERKELGEEPLNFALTSGGGDQWALATLGPGEIRVQRFVKAEQGEVDTTIGTLAIANSSDLSLAMQPNGAMMVVWNAVTDSGDPILEGSWLAPDGTPSGDNQVLRNLVQGSGFDHQEHINSHSLTADRRGNFILAYEENRSIFAHSYEGNARSGHSLTDVASTSLEDSGPYAQLLSGLDNLRVQNVDVNVAAGEDGLLGMVFTKVYTGVDSGTGETITVNKIVRRDYRITYE